MSGSVGEKMSLQAAERTEPQFEPMLPYPGMEQRPGLLAALGRGAAQIVRGRK